MSGPRNGGIDAEHASPARRATDPRSAGARPCRPSTTVAIQKTTTKKSAEVPDHVPRRRVEEVVDAAETSPRSQRASSLAEVAGSERRPDEQRRAGSARRTKTLMRSPSLRHRTPCYLSDGEIGEQVERSGDEHRRVRAGGRARARRPGRRRSRRARSTAGARSASSSAGERARVRRRGRDERVADRREPLRASRRRPCRARIEATTT